MSINNKSRIYAIGVGPGDPELLTRKAEKILRSVPIIVAPTATASDSSFALSIVQEFVSTGRQQVLVREEQVAAEPRALPREDEPRLEQARERLAVHLVHHAAAGDELAQAPRIARTREIHHRWSHARLARSGGDRRHPRGGW